MMLKIYLSLTEFYNKNLYITKCVICGKMAEDVHHISHKRLADEAGFIGHFHMDWKNQVH